MNLRRTFRGPLLWVVVAILVVFGLLEVATSGSGYKTVPLPTIETAIANHEIAAATMNDTTQLVQVTLSKGHSIDGTDKLQSNYTIHYDTTLYGELKASGFDQTKITESHSNPIVSLLLQLLPFVLLVVVMLFFLNQM